MAREENQEGAESLKPKSGLLSGSRFIHCTQLLSSYSMPGAVPDTVDTAVNKATKSLPRDDSHSGVSVAKRPS